MPKPPRSSLPAPDVKQFRTALTDALNKKDDEGRAWAGSQWGVYGFYDYDGEPIYIGQTNERLRTRIRRHLTNQRTDVVAMRVLDVMEVAEIEVWPLWEHEGKKKADAEAAGHLNSLEYSAYLKAIEKSQFGVILNEKIPPVSPVIELPPSLRVDLVWDEVREERAHADIRLARRADTLSRLTAVARERGEVTEGLRRVIVVQSLRLAYLAAARLAVAEGRPIPDPSVIQSGPLVGDVTEPDPTDEDED